MASTLQTRQNVDDQINEPANILNDLALNYDETPSIPVGISASEGRRYPTRGRRNLTQGSEPLKTSASIAGKLNRPTNRRARVGSGTSKEIYATDNLGPEAEIHASAAAAKPHKYFSRAKAEKSASVHSNESALHDINYQEAESSIQDEPSVEDNHIYHKSSGFQELLSEHADHLELFGQESAWAAVLDGAQSVGISISGDESLPRLKSRMIKKLAKTTELAESLFKGLLPEQDVNEVNQDKLQVQLGETLAEITESVTKLDEAATGKEASTVINDIYAHAIPKLVFMLQSALRCRTSDYINSDDTETLQAMISIQDTILLLCEKAAEWRIRPDSETPIVRPTRQKMRPNLREVRKAFQAELNRRQRLTMQKQRERMIAEAHERRFEKITKENVENERKRKEKAIKIKEDLDRTRRRLGLQPRERLTSQNRVGGEHEDENPGHLDSSNQWTDEQNLELMVQLQNPVSRHLPGV